MHIVQRLSAASFLAAAAALALLDCSFAETRAVLTIGEATPREIFPGPSPSSVNKSYPRIEMESAQADTPSAAVPEPAKPQADKSVNSSPVSPPVAPVAANPPVTPASTPVFPTAVDPKYVHELGIMGRMRTCADQFTANKANNANGGMKWIDRSGGYYRECSKRLKG